MNIAVPENVNYIINTLIQNGYEAYAVGGCVRDSILGKTPKDWDITTSAKPDKVKELFKRTIDTGIEHGTVTIMLDKVGYEVTTYRVDGEYEDNRHPKNVEFTTNLTEDLKRRDFTMNAMAYNEIHGLVDEFDGVVDLESKQIKCVGDPLERFNEDALRMLRAVRFAAQLGYKIHEDTLRAISIKAENLEYISAERIQVELNKTITSDNPNKILISYNSGITKIIFKEFDDMMITEQNNPNHIYNVGEHTIKAVENIGSDHILRWTMLLHDIGKPKTKTIDENGIGHFYGHAEVSADMAKEILKRLRFDNYTIDTVVRLVRWHSYDIKPTKKAVRKAANKIGVDIMEMLFEVKKADILAKNPLIIENRLLILDEVVQVYNQVKSDNDCINLNQLAINGKDLIEIGIKPGILIGNILNDLLQKVLEEPKLNKKEILIEEVKQQLKV